MSLVPGTFDAHREDLDALARATRLRSLVPRSGLDFASNDYLGLASSCELAEAVRSAIDRGVAIGSGGSRLLRGNHDEHEQLEAEAARFFGSESALYLASGFAANSALFSTLPQRGDLVIADERVHASAHEGLRLGRAQHLLARHNDAGHFDALARNWRDNGGSGRIWLAVESLYSMDGDRAELDALVEVADARDAVLLIDEAHAVGVFGDRGRGLAQHLHGRANVVTLVTCGKALGCEGALVLAPSIVREFLVNRARGFIFSTAPSPLMAAVARGSLELLERQPWRRQRLWRNVEVAADAAGKAGIARSQSQILPIVLGDEPSAMRAAASLRASGFDVRAIRPPTVAPGTSRLRISITLNVTEDDIRLLFAELERTLASVHEPA